MVECAAMHLDGGGTGNDRHVDFRGLSTPDFPLQSSPGNKDAMETSTGRTELRALRTSDLVEVHGREFFTHASLQIPQKSVAYRDVFVPALALRTIECGTYGGSEPVVLARK